MTLRIKRETGFEENHEINVVPFIDVMLVLLIIFMVAAPLATVSIQVNLPDSTATPSQKPQHPVYLTIKSDHTLVLDELPVTLQTLAAALDEKTKGNKQTRIYLRADKSIQYDALMDALDSLQAAGYSRIALVGAPEASCGNNCR